MTQISGCISPEEMPAISRESSDAFERFVEAVTVQAISHVASSAGVLRLLEEESEQLKSHLDACLRPVRQLNKDPYGQARLSLKHSLQVDLLAHKIIEQLVGYKISDDTRFDLDKALNRSTFRSNLNLCIRQFLDARK